MRGIRVVAVLWMALAAASLGGCDASQNVRAGGADYPIPNDRPSKFVLLHGSIDPSLNLKLSVHWAVASQNCRYATSRTAGATAPYSTSTPLPIAENGVGDFSTRLAIDGVLPGSCQWRFGSLVIAPPEGFGITLVQPTSSPLKPGQSANGIIRLSCEIMIKKSGGKIVEPKITELICQGDGLENPNQSVIGGIARWQPETTDIEVHIRKGVCKTSPVADCPATS